MCLIIASSSGKRVSKKILEEAARSNRDGGGLAWLSDNKIHFRKGIDFEEVDKILDAEAKDCPWVCHFRIATIGAAIPELTHPFSIDEIASTESAGEAKSVLFQNGTFHTWKEYLLQAVASSGVPLPGAKWSDSRALAFCCGVYGKHFLSLIDNHSRFLVFDATEPPERRMQLWGEWHTVDGFQFSTRSTSAFYEPSKNNSSAGGGARSSFTPTEETGEENANEEEAKKGVTSIIATPSQKSTEQTSAASRRQFVAKPGFDYWKRFSQTGLRVSAENEHIEPAAV